MQCDKYLHTVSSCLVPEKYIKIIKSNINVYTINSSEDYPRFVLAGYLSKSVWNEILQLHFTVNCLNSQHRSRANVLVHEIKLLSVFWRVALHISTQVNETIFF